jgi:hypothetical protein
MNQPIEDWLLELDNPSVRYFTLRHLLDRPEEDAEVTIAQRAIMTSEPVQKILAAQDPEGFWVKSGSGYSPKYQSTAWQILFLAELGVDGGNEQVRRGCEYLIAHAQAAHGGFSAMANPVPSGAIHCLNGNLIWALTALDHAGDPRVQLPCAWGAVKALRALTNLPPSMQSPRVKNAATATVEFLFSQELAKADYPHYERISGEWFKYGFPLSYTSDILEAAFVLCEAGHGNDLRLRNAVDLIISMRQPDGRWLMKHSLNGKMWADIEVKGKPSKWITLRALRVLKAAEM